VCVTLQGHVRAWKEAYAYYAFPSRLMFELSRGHGGRHRGQQLKVCCNVNCREALLAGIDGHRLNARILAGTVVFDIYAVVSHFGSKIGAGSFVCEMYPLRASCDTVLYLTSVQGTTSVLCSRRALESGLRLTMVMSGIWTQLKWAHLRTGPLCIPFE
jgi:hypothetical protein